MRTEEGRGRRIAGGVMMCIVAVVVFPCDRCVASSCSVQLQGASTAPSDTGPSSKDVLSSIVVSASYRLQIGGGMDIVSYVVVSVLTPIHVAPSAASQCAPESNREEQK